MKHPLTRFADFVHLDTDRIADPAVAGIEHIRITGADKSASQFKQALRSMSRLTRLCQLD